MTDEGIEIAAMPSQIILSVIYSMLNMHDSQNTVPI